MRRIAIFGRPSSGKSTIASYISKNLNLKVIEASEHVVYPMGSLKMLMKENELLDFLKNSNNRKFRILKRKESRRVFEKIKKEYGADFIARALHNIHEGDNVIFSGLRGINNARYCRLHNDLVIYVETDEETLLRRLISRGLSKKEALSEINDEEKLFNTQKIKAISEIVVNSSKDVNESLIRKICEWDRMCKRCINTAKNPAITFDEDGYCNICSSYIRNFDPKYLKKELEFLKSFKGEQYDLMAGVSGGKDSSAMLYRLQQMNMKILAVTFDIGYLPKSTVYRAKEICKKLGIDHEVIDIRKHIRHIDRESYEKSLELYEKPFELETKFEFLKKYKEGRKFYSVKCKHPFAFVRSCQICRKVVIRAYYYEAIKRGINALVLGINEWTNLSQSQKNDEYRVSGIRKLQPDKQKEAVYVFHLPFILQNKLNDTKKILDEMGWKPPYEEDLVESNSNSCLFARSTERMARRLLGFHPDSTRLAREVTVGFLSKDEALRALNKIHPYKLTPREVIEKAGILSENISTIDR